MARTPSRTFPGPALTIRAPRMARPARSLIAFLKPLPVYHQLQDRVGRLVIHLHVKLEQQARQQSQAEQLDPPDQENRAEGEERTASDRHPEALLSLRRGPSGGDPPRRRGRRASGRTAS